MFDVRHQEQRIGELKARMQAERQSAARQLRSIVPQTRRAAVVGSLVWSARRALPLLQPLALGLARRAAFRFGGKGLLKVAGLAALAFGAWRLLRSDGGDGSDES